MPTDELARDVRHWELAPDAPWHGFHHLAPGYAITDPNKLIVLTPGFDRETGGYANHGIPAPVVAQYLRENQVVPEKNDLNSLLFLLTPGVESSKAGTLLGNPWLSNVVERAPTSVPFSVSALPWASRVYPVVTCW